MRPNDIECFINVWKQSFFITSLYLHYPKIYAIYARNVA
jgi:hypothetical protein